MNWNPEAYIAAHTALLAAIDAAYATYNQPAYIEICNDAATPLVLATLPLDEPSVGEVSPTTGAVTFHFGAPDPAAANDGTAHHGRLKDAAGTIWLNNLECVADGFPSPMTGKLVLNALAVVSGAPFEGVSLTMAGATG